MEEEDDAISSDIEDADHSGNDNNKVDNNDHGSTSPSDNKESNVPVTEFEKALDTVGLDCKYWSEILMKHFQINNVNQLQYLCDHDIVDLGKHVRKQWEIRALDKLVQLQDKSAGRLEQVVQGPATFDREFAENTNKIHKSLEKIRQALKVPKEVWETQSKKVHLNEILTSIGKRSGNVGRDIVRLTLDDHEVITHASGGLALMGIDLTETFTDFLIPKQTVIRLKGHIPLKAPYKQQSEEVIDSESEMVTAEYHRIINETGTGLSGSINALVVKIAGLYDLEKATYNSTISRSTKTFYSRTKVCSMPIKSCELTVNHVTLTPEVIRHLSDIERLLRLVCREEFINYKCKQFFEIYGSHINLGLLHFGGIYNWIATYHGNTEKSNTSIKNLVSNSLNGYIEKNTPLLNLMTGVKASGNMRGVEGELTEQVNMSETSNTTFNIRKCGGPPEVDDFHDWKHILTSCNSTWNLIDRGQFYGIWTLLQHHSEYFEDTHTLANVLENAWRKARSIQSDRNFSKDNNIVEQLSDFIEDVQRWNKNSNPKKTIGLLSEMVQCRDKKVRIDGNIHNWIQFVNTEKQFKQFFDSIVNFEEAYQSDEKSLIKWYVKQIFKGMSYFATPSEAVRLSWISRDDFEPSKIVTPCPKHLVGVPVRDLLQTDESSQKWDKACTCINIDNSFDQFLKQYELNKFYPNKIELVHLLEISQYSGPPKYAVVPLIFLKALLESDYNARDFILKEYLKQIENAKSTDPFNLYDVENGDDADEDEPELENTTLNPLDLIVAVYIYIDVVLRL